MTIGAIIGAVVAGSSLWSRRRRDRHVVADVASDLALAGRSGREAAEDAAQRDGEAERP